MKNFSYFEPAEVKTALSLLAENKGKAKIMAGGTDLVPQMKRGLSCSGQRLFTWGEFPPCRRSRKARKD